MTQADTRRKAQPMGFTNAEVLAAIACLAVLFMLLFPVVSGVRREARICEAESNLKQVGVALQLFYQKHHCLPKQGSDLSKELAPYVSDPSIFENPLRDGRPLGETLSLLYREPSPTLFDEQGHYLTALASEDGSQSIVLFTGGRVERYSGLAFDLKQGHGTAMETLAQATTAEDENLEPVSYLSVMDDGTSSVKFEATTSQLGEDGTNGTDIFAILLSGEAGDVDTALKGTEVDITLKAGTTTYVLPPECQNLYDLQDSSGTFSDPELESPEDGVYMWPLIDASAIEDGWDATQWSAETDSGWRVRAVVENGEVVGLKVTVSLNVHVTADAVAKALSHWKCEVTGILGVDNVEGPVTVWRESQ